MTAIFMGASGNQKIQFAEGGLDTTVTAMGNAVYDDTGGTDPDDCRAYGVSVSGANYLSLGTFGTLGADTFVDGSSITRTVSGIYYTEVCVGSNDDNLFFCLDDTGMDDDDGDFISIDYNGVNYTRSTRNVFHATLGGASTWIWTNINPNGPTSGNPALVVNV